VNPDTNESSPQALQNSDADKSWIERKAEYYDSIKGNLRDYQRDDGFADGFSASFNGAKITYTAPDNVNVSTNAKIEVFETIVNDPDNKGKSINFADMPHDMAIRLAAACVLNNKKMSGNIPQFTPEDINMLRQELGDRFALFERKLTRRDNADTNETPRENTEATSRNDNAQDAPKRNELSTTEFSEEDKQKISQALDNQVEMARLIRDGQPSAENAEAMARYNELSANDRADKMMLAKYFYQNPEAFKEIITAKLNEGGENKLTDEQAKIAGKIDELKKRRDNRTTAPEGGTSFADDRKARREEVDNINKARLGISDEFTDSKGVKHTKLEGDALDKFINNNRITGYTYERLGGKDAEFKAKCDSINPPRPAHSNERSN